MKKRTKFLIQINMLLICFFCFENYSIGQEKLNIKVGICFPERLHAGVRYQLSQFQFGAYIGGYPFGDYRHFTLSGDISYHFGGHSDYSERKPWFLRSGYTYSRSDSESKTYEDDYLNLRIGRDLNISDQFGFEIDFGFFINFNHEESSKDPTNDWEDSEGSSGYFFGIGMFWRL